MNRRTALMVSMFLGGLVPQSLWAQTRGRKPSKTRDKTFAPVSTRDDQPNDPAVAGDEPPAPFAPEPGFQWQRYPIARYTKAASNQTNPQKAIIDWIFKRTGTRRVARREDRGPLREPHRAAGLQFARSSQASRRGRRALHQRGRRHPVRPRPVHRRSRYALAILGFQPAHLRGQRPPGSADLDDAGGRRGPGRLADAESARVSASWPTSGSR